MQVQQEWAGLDARLKSLQEQKDAAMFHSQYTSAETDWRQSDYEFAAMTPLESRIASLAATKEVVLFLKLILQKLDRHMQFVERSTVSKFKMPPVSKSPHYQVV